MSVIVEHQTAQNKCDFYKSNFYYYSLSDFFYS